MLVLLPAKVFAGVAAAGLLVLGAGASAADPAAIGWFSYGRTVLVDPAPGICHTVAKNTPGPELARNATNSPVTVFTASGCTGTMFVIKAGQAALVDIRSVAFAH